MENETEVKLVIIGQMRKIAFILDRLTLKQLLFIAGFIEAILCIIDEMRKGNYNYSERTSAFFNVILNEMVKNKTFRNN